MYISRCVFFCSRAFILNTVNCIVQIKLDLINFEYIFSKQIELKSYLFSHLIGYYQCTK